ncbi:MAG: hypothetical protein K6A15_01680 [Treponema sp.]|nr:hypothetical protein [Treponema sp.]
MINYRGTPLFGEGSSVSHTSEFFAISGTVLFWLIFMIFALVIKPQPEKPKYKEVQIVLSSTPVVQKTEESPATAEAASAAAAASAKSEVSPVQPAVETPAPAPKVEKTVQKTVEKKAETPKPAPKKTEAPKPQPTQKQAPAQQKSVSEPIEYAVDPMEAFAKQTAQKPKKEFDWAQFDDDEVEETSTPDQVRTVHSNEPVFSGSAGTAASTESAKVTSTSSSNNSKSQNVSISTSQSLEGIRNSTYRGNAANGVQSETAAKTKTSGTGKVEMEMSNGRSRALISPASPVINLSAQAAATIDTSKTVTINFKVLEAGNVTEIKITPESILTFIVRDEIKAQISKWLFEAADYTATANFEYKIIKR